MAHPLQAKAQDARAVAAGSHAALPRDANATPQETVIATLGGFRFVGLGGVPLITRKAGGTADFKRRAFLKGIAPLRAGTVLPLDFYAREMGRVWTKSLPADFPAAYRPNPPPGTPPPDLCAAVAVLLRIGLLAVDGFMVDAVTRTDFQPSQLGYLFIRNEEGLAPQIYWPGNEASGVTVGPGYDTGSRSYNQVLNDLTSIGLTYEIASKISNGAGLLNKDASQFVKDNKKVADLSLIQQQALFTSVIPAYIELVRRASPKSLLSRLFQHEFDALLSLAWNLRRYGQYTFNRNVLNLDMVKADWSIKSLTGGGPGIPGRRVRETMLLTDAVYSIKQLVLRNIDVDFYDDMPSGTTGYG